MPVNGYMTPDEMRDALKKGSVSVEGQIISSVAQMPPLEWFVKRGIVKGPEVQAKATERLTQLEKEREGLVALLKQGKKDGGKEGGNDPNAPK